MSRFERFAEDFAGLTLISAPPKALPPRAARLATLIRLGVMPSIAEEAITWADARGQTVPTPDELATMPEPDYAADIAQARQWWLFQDSVPMTWKRLLAAQVVGGAKFNPYHDAAGRFSDAPGVKLSYHAFQRMRERGKYAGVKDTLRWLTADATPDGDWYCEMRHKDKLAGYLVGTGDVVKTVLGPWYERGKLRGQEVAMAKALGAPLDVRRSIEWQLVNLTPAIAAQFCEIAGIAAMPEPWSDWTLDALEALLIARSEVEDAAPAKFNPYHDERGRFASGGGSTSFLETVKTGTEASSATLGGGVTDTVLVSFVDDGSGVWKAVEQPGDNAMGHNGNCEVAAYRLSQLLDMDNVPTTEFMARAGVDGTVQQWIDGLAFELRQEAFQTNKFRSISASDFENVLVLDTIMNNPDRHPGNWALDAQGKLWAIDHGHAEFSETHTLSVRNPKQPNTDMECARVLENSLITYARRSHAKGDTNHYDQWIPSTSANGEVVPGTTRAWQVSPARIARWRKIDKDKFMRAFAGVSQRPVGDGDGADIEAAWRNFQNVLNTGRIAWW